MPEKPGFNFGRIQVFSVPDTGQAAAHTQQEINTAQEKGAKHLSEEAKKGFDKVNKVQETNAPKTEEPKKTNS